MEKCEYYHDESTLWGHGLCFAEKETPPCFLDGDTKKCDIMDSILPVEMHVPAQTVFTTIDMKTVIDWIWSCNNLKELRKVKMELSNAIIHFHDPKDDDDFRSRA